jgi:hypothetical protein
LLGNGGGMVEGVVAERTTRDRGARLEAGFIAVGIVLGCQVLCMAVPVATLWLLSRFLGTAAECLIAGLAVMPVALIGVVWLLSAANQRYLRLVGDRGGWRRGPLEAALPASVMIAILAALLYFIFFANHGLAAHEQLIP